MEWFLIGFLLLLGVGGLLSMANLSNMKSKFANLGNLVGKTEEEIVGIVGDPTSISATGDGNRLLQWQHISEAGGYHIALLFDEYGICLGVTHESAT